MGDFENKITKSFTIDHAISTQRDLLEGAISYKASIEGSITCDMSHSELRKLEFKISKLTSVIHKLRLSISAAEEARDVIRYK